MRFLFDRATIFFYRPVGYRVAPSSVTCGDSFPQGEAEGWGAFGKNLSKPLEFGKNVERILWYAL